MIFQVQTFQSLRVNLIQSHNAREKVIIENVKFAMVRVG
jgi:hypothetical protein